MLDQQEIIDALESTCDARHADRIGSRQTPNKNEIKNYRDHLMRFLDELDAGFTVGDLRETLENY